jgi:putative ABC transport system permease protein
MTTARLILNSATYHWRTNLAVILGVATAVAVLAGALVVGDSVRGSLRDIALGRLGRTVSVLHVASFVREGVAAEIAARAGAAAPMVVATGIVTHEASGRRAASVNVYGVDERFWSFHALEAPEGVQVSPALARELAAQPGDVLLARLQRPSQIPLESLFGRRDEVGRTIRLTLGGILSRDRLGEFVLQPQQAEVRSVFVPLRRVQRDLGVTGSVNTVLLGMEAGSAEVLGSLSLEDLGAKVLYLDAARAVSVETVSGVLNMDLQRAAVDAATRLGLRHTPVFTYLANTIRSGDRAIPYSLIAATDLSALPGGGAAPAGADAIVLNEWAARELGVTPGAPVEIEYFLWDSVSGLETKQHRFTADRIVRIEGLAADRQLAPDYPGITGADSVADWDPPFPLDLSRVRPLDEQYWDEFKTTPKAFIQYERGRALWSTRYGDATSVRITVPPDRDPKRILEDIQVRLREVVQPQSLGASVVPVRRTATDASVGATDFGEYFTYFSFFLVASALLLAVLFFRLGIEQRLKQIGVLRAAGFPIARVRVLLLTEAVILAALGSAAGIAGAIAYAEIIVYGLRTWWVGAVGTTLLETHVTPVTLALGALAGVATSVVCVALSLRSVARMSPRALLTAASIEGAMALNPARSRRSRRIGYVLTVLGAAAVVAGFADRDVQAGAFFAAGAALLAAGLFFLAAWLRARDVRLLSGRGAWATARLGFRSASFRPARTVLSAALIASAAFIIVAVDAFRRGGGEIAGDRQSGTGGYVLLAKSELPIVQNPNAPETLDLTAEQMGSATFTRFRVRPGEDASCLNLYRPTNPTIVAPEARFIESGRFSFAASLAETDAERSNPWLLLQRELPDGAIPAIADATSLQYVLHAAVGDEFTIDTGSGESLRLRFVASLADSVLQGELVIAEEQFVRHFPSYAGYRLFLIDAPGIDTATEADALIASLERALEPFGFDAVTAADRLAAYHRVENTYLSTFQALGGLGLLLGTIGLATILFRNVLERRRELALLRAVGYDARRLSLMIVAEASFVLAVGLATGTACAALAIAPAWLGQSGTLPGAGVALLLCGVAVAGILSSVIATHAALRGNMLAALRAE